MQILLKILTQPCLRTVHPKDEREKHSSVSSRLLLVESCSHGVLTSPSLWVAWMGEPYQHRNITHCCIRKALGQEARFLVHTWSEALSAQSTVWSSENYSKLFTRAWLESEVREMWDSAQEPSSKPTEGALSLVQICSLLSILKISESRTKLLKGWN